MESVPTWGKKKYAVQTRLDIHLPSLLLHLNHPPHNYIANFTIVPWTFDVRIMISNSLTGNRVFTGVTDISLFTLSTTPARLAHKTCSSFVKSFYMSKCWAFIHLLSRCHVCAMTSHEARIPDQFGLGVNYDDVLQSNKAFHLDKMRSPCNDITRSHKMCRFLFFTFSHHL